MGACGWVVLVVCKCVIIVVFVVPPGPCESDPCENGGTCQSTDGGDYACECLTGWTGVNCETRELQRFDLTMRLKHYDPL